MEFQLFLQLNRCHLTISPRDLDIRTEAPAPEDSPPIEFRPLNRNDFLFFFFLNRSMRKEFKLAKKVRAAQEEEEREQD